MNTLTLRRTLAGLFLIGAASMGRPQTAFVPYDYRGFNNADQLDFGEAQNLEGRKS